MMLYRYPDEDIINDRRTMERQLLAKPADPTASELPPDFANVETLSPSKHQDVGDDSILASLV